MTIIAIVPLIVMLIGFVVYMAAANPKAAEAGRLAYFAGMLVALFVAAHQTLKFG